MLGLAFAAYLKYLSLNENAPEQDIPGEILEVSFIDVGQGDCILISCGGENMLIDCGEMSEFKSVKNYLDSRDVESLKYVVGTHPHSDHMGGMADVVRAYDIGEFIIPPLNDENIPTSLYFEKFLDAAEDADLKLTAAKPGRKEQIGSAEFEIIYPDRCEGSNANNYSVGIILRHGETGFIFTGDAEIAAEEEMVRSGRLEHINVYKAGHHGSSTSSSDDLLEAIRPDIAVISCGKDNNYGHPSPEALKRIEKFTGKIYRTDESGTVKIISDGTALEITEEKRK